MLGITSRYDGADVIAQAGDSPGAPLTRIVCAGVRAWPVLVAAMSIDDRLSVSGTLFRAVTRFFSAVSNKVF